MQASAKTGQQQPPQAQSDGEEGLTELGRLYQARLREFLKTSTQVCGYLFTLSFGIFCVVAVYNLTRHPNHSPYPVPPRTALACSRGPAPALPAGARPPPLAARAARGGAPPVRGAAGGRGAGGGVLRGGGWGLGLNMWWIVWCVPLAAECPPSRHPLGSDPFFEHRYGSAASSSSSSSSSQHNNHSSAKEARRTPTCTWPCCVCCCSRSSTRKAAVVGPPRPVGQHPSRHHGMYVCICGKCRSTSSHDPQHARQRHPNTKLHHQSSNTPKPPIQQCGAIAGSPFWSATPRASTPCRSSASCPSAPRPCSCWRPT